MLSNLNQLLNNPMKQFISGADAAWADLERQASGSCMRFRDQPMPVGCTPTTADVGFAVDANSRAAMLYVQRGVTYGGSQADLRLWFAVGEKRFGTFSQLRNWIQLELGPSYAPANHTAALELVAPPITDIAAVHDGLRRANRAVVLSEEDLALRLQQRVLGQDRPLRVLAGVICRHHARTQPMRPAVVLAIGPTGVGKTRTAEVLAAELRDFSEGDAGYQYLRLDMSEYAEAHRISQLLGAPQGYIGHNEGSQLLDALRANPRTIVLFDEIEKAHPAILRALMNAMDAGRLSSPTRSANSRDVDCRKAVFFFSSNIEAAQLLDEIESRQSDDSAVEDEICRRRLQAAGIAPEIVGRIGRFLVYRTLSPEKQAEIMALSIAEVGSEYGLKIEKIESSVIVELMGRLQSADFGARPARFLIDEVLGGEFAKVASQHGRASVAVLGPPYRCEVHADDSLNPATLNQSVPGAT